MRGLAPAVFVVVAIITIVGIDVAFFRGRFWERLMANVGVVLLLGAFYLRFFTVVRK